MSTQQKKLKDYYIGLGVILSLLVMLLCTPIQSSAQIYYVSNSTGNEQNDGLSKSTPWKTLSKVSGTIFNAGDYVKLKAGDVWNESLYLKGQGSSSNFITLCAYDAGSKPKISPLNNPTWGIYINGYSGWKIIGIEICNAQTGIRLYNDTTGTNDGFWLENLYIHDIEGAPEYPNNSEPGLYMSYGISTYKSVGAGYNNLTNVTIKNVYVIRTDAPACIASVTNLMIDGLTAENSYKEGVLLSNINSQPTDIGMMKNSVILNSGYSKGMYWGVAGLQFNTTKYFTTQDTEIAYTKNANNSPDGVGVDFEGNNVDVTLLRCNIHDNNGSAVMLYRNPTWGIDNENISVIDCNISNNGLKDVQNEAAFIRQKWNQYTAGTISGNNVTRASNQPINYINYYPGGASDPKLTRDFPTAFTVYNNAFSPSPSEEKVWYFNTDGDNEDWSLLNAINKPVISGGYYNGDIIAQDPFIRTGSDINYDLRMVKLVKIKYRNSTSATKAQVYFTTTTDPEWNETKSKKFTIYAYDSNYTEYTIDMSDVPRWAGTLKQLRFDPITNTGEMGNFSIEHIKLIGGWQFNKDGDRDGWSAIQSISNEDVSNGCYSGNIIETDPYIRYEADIDFDITRAKQIRIKYKNSSSSTTAKLYFTTNNDTVWDETKSKSFTVNANDSEYTEYLIDMSNVTEWAGTLKRLRFDPTNNSTATGLFSIDYIWIMEP